MLQLINIQKDYAAGSGVVHALKGIDLQFRENEFVSILVGLRENNHAEYHRRPGSVYAGRPGD